MSKRKPARHHLLRRRHRPSAPRIAFPPVLAALRWRVGSSASLLAVALLAVFAAAFGPFFLSAADTEVLHSQLVAAGPARDDITFTTPGQMLGGQGQLKSLPQVGTSLGVWRWFEKPVYTYDSGTTLAGFRADLVYRTGVCAHLSFVSGHCPTGPFQITMTTRDAQQLKVKVGGTIRVPSLKHPLLVAGITRIAAPTGAAWLGSDFFQFALPTFGPTGQSPGAFDAFFTTAKTLAKLPVSVEAQVPLRVESTLPGDVSELAGAANRFLHEERTRYGLSVQSQLGGVLRGYLHQSNDIASIVGVVALQLILLTLFVLYVLVSRTSMSRRSEVALAKLRGASLLSLVTMAVAEPVLILLAAVPIGMLLAFLAVELISGAVLHHAPVPFTLLALLAALAAFASGLVAIGAGSRKLLSRSLVDELRAAEDQPSPAARAAWEGAAIALAAAGLLELATAGVLSGAQTNPIALFAPGLIALGLAVPGARLLPLICRLAIRRTRYSKRLAGALAVRQVVRRPTNLRLLLILTVAVGLATFSVIGWSVSGTNRTLRADFDLGAAKVVQVSVPGSVNLVEAVRKADPSGRYAMAVMESRQANGELLAVDASRLAKVAYWPKSISRSSIRSIVRWLEPKLLPPLELVGRAVKVTADLVGSVSPSPDLAVNLLDSGGGAQEVDFGYLQPGVHTYTASVPAACGGGCRVTTVSPTWNPPPTVGSVTVISPYQQELYPAGPTTAKYSVELSGFEQLRGSAWEPLPDEVYQQGYWGTNSGSARISANGKDLTVSVVDSVNDAAIPSAVPAPLPRVLHGVATAASQPSDPVTNTVDDFDGTPLRVNTTPEVAALPNLGAVGYLMSLQTAMEAQVGAPLFTKSYVWLAPKAPARILTRLEADHINIVQTTTPARQIAAFNNGGLGLGYQFFVYAAGAAAALALATAVLSFFLGARRRAFELALLRALGLPRRTLFRSLLLEQALILVPGLILGMAAAIIAALVALPAVPEFGSGVGQPPLDLTLPWLTLVLVGVVLLVMLLATAVLTATTAARDIDLRDLRMEFR